MSRSAWLTLGDVRLVTLRVVAAGGLPALLLALTRSPSAAVAWLAFATWAFAPPALVERFALRHDASAPFVALGAGLAAAAFVPIALLQAWWLKDAHELGPVEALDRVVAVPLFPLAFLGLGAYAAFAGATYVATLFESRTAPRLSDEGLILLLFGFSVGLPVLLCYGLASAFGQLVPEPAPATPDDRV